MNQITSCRCQIFKTNSTVEPDLSRHAALEPQKEKCAVLSIWLEWGQEFDHPKIVNHGFTIEEQTQSKEIQDYTKL